MFRVVIPARYDSARLPGKAVLPLAGKPMIQWVHERAARSAADEIIIATDDVRIDKAARAFHAVVEMTASTHASGTDRIAEVARNRRWGDDDIIVNVQGDEPLIPPALINQTAALLAAHPRAGIATLASPIVRLEDFLDPNVVKVVVDSQGKALYFSRAPIPWNRDGASSGLASQTSYAGARRHIGIYAYRVGTLKRVSAMSSTQLEECERLEQLRAVVNGVDIRVADAAELPGPDVNTPTDLERVTRMLAGN